MWFLEKTAAAFAILLTFFSVQINARYAMSMSRVTDICQIMAKKPGIQDSNKNDADFFKKCVVDRFKFRLRPGHTKMFVPQINPKHFDGSYIKLIAKRVERFFIRNGNWYNILKKKRIFKANNCRDLLYIISAKYIYALYVLHLLKYNFTPCKTKKRFNKFTYSLKGRGSVCYIKPEYLTCAGEIEFTLLGRESGSLTAQFNQFFKEPIGEDREVPGFNKNSDILMGVWISAFSLESVFPAMFKSFNSIRNFILQVIARKMASSPNMKLLSVAVAIFRMKSYSEKYFNELFSDKSPLRAQRSVAMAFQHWGVELKSFDSKIKAFMQSPHYNYELNYLRRYRIAFHLVMGRLESKDEIPSSYVGLLAQYAICLIYNTPVYLTSGAVRHSVIKQKFTPTLQKYEFEDYWHSMLENWAIATRVYKEECLENNFKITACLLRMSKSLDLMFDAMVQMIVHLKKRRKKVRLTNFEETQRITNHWVKEYRNKGHTELPIFIPSTRKRPIGMWSKRPVSLIQQDLPLNQTDDFPEWSEPEQRIENEKAETKTVVETLDKGKKSSENTKLFTKDAKGAHKNEPLVRESKVTKKKKQLVENNEKTDIQRKKKLLDKDVAESVGSQMNVQTEKNYENSPGIYPTNALTPEDFDLADIEKLDNFATLVSPVKQKFSTKEKSLDTDKEFPMTQTLPDEDMAKSLDENKVSPVQQTVPDEVTMRLMGKDEGFPIRQKLPDEDMARSLDKDSASPVKGILMSGKKTAKSLDEDKKSPVRQTLPNKNMAKSLDEDEKSFVGRTLPDEEMMKSPSYDEESPVQHTVPDEVMMRLLSKDEGFPMTQTMPDEDMAKSLDEDEELPMKQTMSNEEMANSQDENEKVSTNLLMVEPSPITSMKSDTTSMVEPHSKVTADSSPIDMDDDEQMGSSMEENEGKSIGSRMNTEKSMDSLMTKPENQKNPADPHIRKTLNEDSEDSMATQTAKPPDNDHKEPLSSEMKTSPYNHAEETAADLLMTKPFKNKIKESTGIKWTKPPNKATEKTSDSPTIKPLGKDIKGTSGTSMPKPLDEDTRKTSNSPMPTQLKNNFKETAGAETGKPTHDDFTEYSTSDAHDVPKKLTQTKPRKGKTPRFFFSFYRRRRYGYRFTRRRRSVFLSRRRRSTLINRRRRRVFLSRRRRSTLINRRRRRVFLSRRRRSTLINRRRRRVSLSRRRRSASPSRRRRSASLSRRRRINVKSMSPDETKNIKKFLQKFWCHVRPEMEKMTLHEGCMNKIQKKVRLYNRVAFSYFVRVYGKSFEKKMWGKKRKGNVLVKTEL